MGFPGKVSALPWHFSSAAWFKSCHCDCCTWSPHTLRVHLGLPAVSKIHTSLYGSGLRSVWWLSQNALYKDPWITVSIFGCSDVFFVAFSACKCAVVDCVSPPQFDHDSMHLSELVLRGCCFVPLHLAALISVFFCTDIDIFCQTNNCV